MANILITYGDKNFKKSLKRIRKEAKSLRLFDRIIIYTPTDLPSYIKASPLFAFQRLGGYAVWKSYIIYKTFNESKYGDKIIYVDAGCTLQKSIEWNQYFELLMPGKTLIFQYRADFDYNWKISFGVNASVTAGNWIKKSVQDYFSPLFKDNQWLVTEKVWSGALMLCKGENENSLLKEWFTITLLNPELSFDIYGNEMINQDPTFVQHRHDQSLLGILAMYYKEQQSIIFIPETAESGSISAAIIATRLKDTAKKSFFEYVNKIVKKFLGIQNWNRFKFWK